MMDKSLFKLKGFRATIVFLFFISFLQGLTILFQAKYLAITITNLFLFAGAAGHAFRPIQYGINRYYARKGGGSSQFCPDMASDPPIDGRCCACGP